ncbi:MAG TPA: nucleotidyltransferase domain-containing protein [Ramlibacter sp.]|nr:nucleotidyltransferase domain-containing protein [Ramlibacter sp.]
MSGRNRVAVARRFAHRLRERYPSQVKEVILFGSVARGTDGPDSDIDVLVIWSGDHHEGLHRVCRVAFAEVLQGRPYVSAKVLTPKEWARGKRTKNPFVRAILAEGHPLS